MDSQSQPDVLTQVLGGVARHVLTSVAGGLVADGVIKGSDTQMVVGAGMALAGVAWSWWQKVGQAKTLELLKTELSWFKGAQKQAAVPIAPSVPGGPLT